jgi:hypothetical protein
MRRLFIVFAGALTLAVMLPAPALAQTLWWQVGEEVVPTNLPPGGSGFIIVTATNLGDSSADGSEVPVVVSDKLPPGLTAIEMSGPVREGVPTSCSVSTVQCVFKGVLNPYERLAITIKVHIEAPEGALDNEVSVEGGGARASTAIQPLSVSTEPTPVGIQTHGYELTPVNEDGTPATQAGSHPFQLTTTLVMNQVGQPGSRQPVALPKNLRFSLPAGLIGNPTAVAQCSARDFDAHEPNAQADLCPPNTAVGVATVTVNEPGTFHVITLTVPVFNLVPAQGEPARLGFEVLGLVFLVIDTSVRTGADYAVVASVTNAPESAWLLSSQVSLWGTPGDSRHNASRGWECVAGGEYHIVHEGARVPCPASSVEPPNPFLTLPTSCARDPVEEPFASSVELESWTVSGVVAPPAYLWSGSSGEPLGLGDCAQLPFSPSIGLSSDASSAATPTGLGVAVRVPQEATVEANPEGRAEADVRDATVTLPAGVQLNPSAAGGLQACSEGQVGYRGLSPGTEAQEFTAASGSCPDASKLGVVHVRTPLLAQELEGALYLADPAPNGEPGKNPFNSLVAVYLVAEDKEAGVLVKLAGEGKLDPATGQVTTTFKDTPQLPFEELKLQLFGGERASVTTPAFCGSYQASSVFDAWSGAVAEPASTPFVVSSGPGGGPCPSGALGFSPGFLAQSTVTQAGAFSPFELEIGRPDGEQAMKGVSVGLPPGVAAMLSSVTPCPEPPAGVEWSCGPESLVGHSTAWSGLGKEPVMLGGDVYLTTRYDGAPFGLLVRTRAAAGPFDLGYVNVRSRINVNPETAAVTVSTDPGPHGDSLITMLKGIPVQLKRLQVMVDRPDFQFNPTSCDPMAITGTLSGSEGASASVSSRFQVGGCQGLPFHPVLTATVGGHASKANGTGFAVNITSQGLGVANIRKVNLQLPLQLPSRQSTLNQACMAATFQANPASCPEGSVIGVATVHTPVLNSPLTGPAYLVSYGNAKFPDVEFVLQGEGITLVLDGHTDIKNGVTYSRFEAAPDAPFTSFETSLPAGPHGILTAYASEKEPYELCRTTLTMPTTITAQDGAQIEQNTAISAVGCTGTLATSTAKPTRAQLLAKALISCRHRYKAKKAKHERVACERAARKRYAVKKSPRHAKRAAGHHRR